MMQDLLQSEEWERFQQALGRKTERIVGVLAIEMSLPFGKRYLYSPRSSAIRHPEDTPTCPSEAPGERRRKDLTLRNAGAVFWRGEWDSELSTIPLRAWRFGGQVNYQLSIPLVLRRAIEPEWTWRTSLEGSDDEILDRMHEKHRYNVRLAAKRGVVVRATSYKLQATSTDFESYWSLLQETAKRQGISTHPRHYYDVMLATLPNTKVYLAEHSGTPVACAIVAYYGDIATYLHGGSSYEHRSLMAPHLLHWTAMRDARAAGMKWYDFGGVAPENPKSETRNPKPEWEGLSRFKRGFGGEAVHHPPMRDLVFHRGWYVVFSALARARSRD